MPHARHARYFSPPTPTPPDRRRRPTAADTGQRKEELQLALVATLGALKTTPQQAAELMVYMEHWVSELERALPPVQSNAPRCVASQIFRELEVTALTRALEAPARSRASAVTRVLERLDCLRDSIRELVPGGLS